MAIKATSRSSLIHWTCHHGAAAIGRRGYAEPFWMHRPDDVAKMSEEWRWMSDLVWFTNHPGAGRIALGLQSTILDCDRMSYRYRVLDDSDVVRWLDVCSEYPRPAVTELHSGDHSPGLWFVSTKPVPVELIH